MTQTNGPGEKKRPGSAGNTAGQAGHIHTDAQDDTTDAPPLQDDADYAAVIRRAQDMRARSMGLKDWDQLEQFAHEFSCTAVDAEFYFDKRGVLPWDDPHYGNSGGSTRNNGHAADEAIIIAPVTPERSEVPELPESARLDADLGSDACPWLDAYIEFSRQWSPRAFDGFHEACGLWILSTVAARRVMAHFGGPRFTPLYLALVARSSLWAKSTTAEIAEDTLRAAGLSRLLAADDATPQKFIANLTGRIPDDFDDLPPALKERAETRLAFPAQRGWFYEEFGGKLEAMGRDGGFMADFRSILRRFDDCPPTYEYDSVGRGSDYAVRPYLALLANLTPADMAGASKPGGSLWRDGFWARFAFVTPPADCERGQGRFPTGQRLVPPEIVRELRHWHDRLGEPEVLIESVRDEYGKATGKKRAVVEPIEAEVLTLGGGVEDAFYRYHDALTDLVGQRDNEDLDACYARFAEKALRVAMLFASLRGSPIVTLHHWARGQEIAERWRAGLHAAYAELQKPPPNEEERQEERVLRFVAKLGNPTAREVAQRIQGLSTSQAEAILEHLVRAGVVTKDRSARSTRYQTT